jgi:hypothetical protein
MRSKRPFETVLLPTFQPLPGARQTIVTWIHGLDRPAVAQFERISSGHTDYSSIAEGEIYYLRISRN